MVAPTPIAWATTWPPIDSLPSPKPAPPSDTAQNTPVSSAPTMPPTQWMPNTSRESS